MDDMNSVELAIEYAISNELRKILALALDTGNLDKVIDYINTKVKD